MNGVVDHITAWGASQPEKTALDFYGEVWSYARLGDAIGGWAARFAHIDIKAGDVVLVFLPQGPEGIAVYFGLMRIGAVPSFMPLPSAKQDHRHYWESHRALLELIQPAAVVTAVEHRAEMQAAGFGPLVPHLAAIDEAWPENLPAAHAQASEERTALLQHSSGTTALKKGVALSHGAILRQVSAYAQAISATSDDVVVSWLPVYHDMGLVACTLMPLILGQKIVLLDPFRWVSEPKSFLTAITEHRGTLAWTPNFTFELLAKAVRYEPGSLDLSSMRAFIDCSEPCKPTSFDRFLAKFEAAGVRASQLQVCYAMAETVFAVTQTDISSPVKRIKLDAGLLASQKKVVEPSSPDAGQEMLSVGLPVRGMDVQIVDEQGTPLEEGQVGEIQLASEFLFDGYFNRPEITQAKFRGDRYRTSDLGFFWQGELFVLGRIDDLVIVHGRNYFSHEIEAVVNFIPGLKPGRNVAVGVFNDTMGSDEAVVIAESESLPPTGPQALEVKRAVKHEVAEAMGLELRDVRIVPLGWLVKTTSGKISRSLNRDKYLAEFVKTNA